MPEEVNVEVTVNEQDPDDLDLEEADSGVAEDAGEPKESEEPEGEKK